ncbi:MAG TPA: hypothetical protein DD417_03585 [Elusimicrobia bacterium]|nr:hypothetical protein [Elusimicrobiota bacterium]
MSAVQEEPVQSSSAPPAVRWMRSSTLDSPERSASAVPRNAGRARTAVTAGCCRTTVGGVSSTTKCRISVPSVSGVPLLPVGVPSDRKEPSSPCASMRYSRSVGSQAMAWS